MSNGLELIAKERQRQIDSEGWTDQHDDGLVHEELARAASCYAMPSYCRSEMFEALFWPWSKPWWKPSPEDRIRELAKAGALIAAEIDRLQRLKIRRQAVTSQEAAEGQK